MSARHGRPLRGLMSSKTSPHFEGYFGRMFRSLRPATFGANEAETAANLGLLADAMTAAPDPMKDGQDAEEICCSLNAALLRPRKSWRTFRFRTTSGWSSVPTGERVILRRDLITLLGGAVFGVPVAVRAQLKAMPVIGYLSPASASPGPFAPNVAAFRQGLSEAGYVEGQNVAIEYRWAEGQYDRLPALAADLVGHKIDVIATSGGPASVRAAKGATSTIPIVFMGTSDPVGNGLVASLARPGGNITGISPMQTELMAKRLELLCDLVPQARVIGLLVNNEPQTERIIRDVQEAARAKRVQLPILKANNESEIDTAFDSLVRLQAGALVVAPDPFFGSRRDRLLALASRHAVPAIYAWRDFAVFGGLISYGSSLTDNFRQAGAYVGRILKGAKPADLPVQQPTKFELIINLKTAKALGLTMPPSLLLLADEVIQ